MSAGAIECFRVIVGEESFEVGAFVGEEMIESIQANEHDDGDGVDVEIVMQDGKRARFKRRGSYTLFMA